MFAISVLYITANPKNYNFSTPCHPDTLSLLVSSKSFSDNYKFWELRRHSLIEIFFGRRLRVLPLTKILRTFRTKYETVPFLLRVLFEELHSSFSFVMLICVTSVV